jgi:HSP20 family molecular chaperone IbpA
MDRLEHGMAHMVWDAHDHRVTPCLRPLPIVPKFDVSETKDAFELKVTLPGISKENIRLNVDSDKVEVFARADEGICRPFYVSLDPHAPLDPDSVEATLLEGVLKVRAAKKKKKRLMIR